MTEDSEASRRLRPKERKVYTDEDIDDDEIEGKRNFSVEEKIKSNKYNGDFVKEILGEDLTVKYFQENGFVDPMVVRDKAGLGMKIPSKNFNVEDVRQCVGSRRMLDVMDVTTQKGIEMTMKEWVRYFENKERHRLLNVISLEFSHTRLENYVEQPECVRAIDWIDTAWPRHLKECQTETTNILNKMKYPKVQKYCLMSVKGCFTDFHIDMGGTSVWYHILHGSKLFWLIPPSEKNLELYENWVLSGKQGDTFFADTVEKCQRIRLEPGWTFFIPTGWIHAVFTPEDSLVFGGNFLHTFNLPMQLRISQVEDKTRVPQKFRYPFLGELHWYVLERYVSILTGKNHRQKSEAELLEEMEEKEELKKKVKVKTVSPPDSADEKSNDSSGSSGSVGRSRGPTRRESEDAPPSDLSPPRSPVMEEQSNVQSPESYRPKSPQPPQSPKSPKPSRRSQHPGEDNSAPKSPKGSSTSSSSLIVEPRSPKSPRSTAKKTETSSTTSSKRITSVKVEKCDEGSEIKAYFSQSELIRPVSVKLENCMLLPEKARSLLEGGNSTKPKPSWSHITKYEVRGLQELIRYIEDLPPAKVAVPKDIPEPDALLKDAKRMLADHEGDDPVLAATGEFLLKWPAKKKKVPTATLR